MAAHSCPLCDGPGGELVWQSALFRVVLVDDPAYPGFCRVILNRHVAEMTDLDDAEAGRLLSAVFVVERCLRECVEPDKVNLASLGNQVPHLHWHVIPRWRDDRHFPDPIWAAPRRDGAPPQVDLARLKATLATRFLTLEQLGRS